MNTGNTADSRGKNGQWNLSGGRDAVLVTG